MAPTLDIEVVGPARMLMLPPTLPPPPGGEEDPKSVLFTNPPTSWWLWECMHTSRGDDEWSLVPDRHGRR